MLQGKNLTYIRHERNQGIGKNSGQPYDFANITLSDGLESFKLDLKPELTEKSTLENLRKGDKVTVIVDVYENFNRTQFIVSDVLVNTTSKAG